MIPKFFSEKIKTFLKTTYLKDIVSQAGLVFIAQLIPLLFSPLISRFYDENALAEVTGMVSLGSLCLVFTSFRLGQAIVLENDKTKAKQLMVLIFYINIFTILLLILILYSFKSFFISSFKVDNVLFLIPLFIAGNSIFNTFDNWFVRQKKFKYRAYSKIIESIVYITFSFILYFSIGNNEFGLALGKILGVVISVIFLIKLSKFKFPKYNFKDLQLLLHKYQEFPVHNMPANFINVISLQIIIIFIGLYFSKEEVGFFGLANMVVLAPISFVSQAVSSIFYQKINENVINKNFKEVKNTFLKTLALLTVIGVPGFLVLWFFGETLIPVIFGENWVLSGMVVKSLSFVFLIQIVVAPISGPILISLGKIKLNAMWQYSRFFFMVTALLAMVHILELEYLEFIRGYSYCVVISYLVYFLVIYRVVHKKSLQ